MPGLRAPLLQLIGAGSPISDRYWLKLSQINWHELFYSEHGPGVEFFLDLKNRIEEELAPDFLLVDSRTGITETAGVATTLYADKLVCLIVPTRENLEGARTVLRSLNRLRREASAEHLDITIALSRLPIMNDPAQEERISDEILEVLNQEADDLRDTLSCSEVFILHSETALQVREELRVGGTVSPDDSVLLRDYLRLFANLVPKNLIEPRVGQLINRAKEKIWEDPDGAVKEVEELAESFGHPENYRALLRFYEVRNIVGPSVLKRAQRLWELTRDSDDLHIWSAIKKNFPVSAEPRWRRSQEWAPSPEFLDSVWREAGKRDAEFALRLGDWYSAQNKDGHAADILLEAMNGTEPTAKLSARCINFLDYARRHDEAETLISRVAARLGDEPDVAIASANHALRTKDALFAAQLANRPAMNYIRERQPLLAARVLHKAGLAADANDILETHVRNAASLTESEIQELADTFDALGRGRELEEKLRGKVPAASLLAARRRVSARTGLIR